jgi:HTH-type transcriptional regulator / antitoxin HipB
MDPSDTVVWRSGAQLGAAVRAARERMGLTQAELARRAVVGLKFLYELESGKDTLRADKVLDVLDVLGLELVIGPRRAGKPARGPEARTAMVAAREPRARYGADAPSRRLQPDYIGMACTTAGVSLRKALTPDELVRSLLTGEPARGKEAHFIVLLEEAPPELLRGLVAQVGPWAKPGAVARNVRRIAARIGVRLKAADWLKAA